MIMRYKKILVAVDISAEADYVLQAAADMAKLYQAQLNVIHAIEPIASFYNISPEYYSPMTEEIVRENASKHLRASLEKVDVDPQCLSIVEGRPGDEIIQQAQTLQCDLIIVGSHGRHGIQLLLGSTANSVIHHALCDVLAVRIQPSNSKS